MKICDDRNYITFGEITVTELFSPIFNDDIVYMKIKPVIVPGSANADTYNAVNVETGYYSKFRDEEVITPVRGEFHREGIIYVH